MSEPEFEAFLERVCRRLRLSRVQRGAIADELRDHLEERLATLATRGVPPEKAKQLALAEFGDESLFALHITAPHAQQQRRRLMRYSFGSTLAIVTTFVMASFYWPAHRQDDAHTVQAQTGIGLAPAVESKPEAIDEELVSREELTAKLKRRTVPLAFDAMPLSDVVDFLTEAHDVPILIDRQALADMGIETDTPITLKVAEGVVSLKTALQLVLRLAGGGNEFAPTIRDGLIMLTTVSDSYEVQVYNCRDLLKGVQISAPSRGGGQNPMGGSGGGMFQIAPVVGQEGEGAVGPAVGGEELTFGLFSGYGATTNAGYALIHVIQEGTAPGPWVNTDGDGGTITEFNGLITVRHSQQMHEKISDLLKKLRKATE